LFFLGILGLTISFTVVVSVLSLALGPSGIDVVEAFRLWMEGKEGLGRDILVKIRFPRWLLGLSVGGALSLAGLILQSLFANPLVEPYTLGISGGATLGVCIGIVVGKWMGWQFPLFVWSLGGGFLFMGILYLLSRRRRNSLATIYLSEMLLLGLMLSFLSSGMVMFFLALARAADLHQIISWTMGSLEQGRPVLLPWIGSVSVVGCVVAWLLHRELNAFLLGEEEAFFLGVSVEVMKRVFFVLAVVLTAFAIAGAGVIGFVGLLVPNLYRKVVGTNHRWLVPLTFVGGGGFLVGCDLLARVVIAPLELPVGVITGILGGVLFMGILLGEKRQ